MQRLATVGILGLLTSGCGGDDVKITVGAIHDLTGPAAEPIRAEAFALALRHANQGLLQRGYKGLQLDLIVRNSEGRGDLAVTSGVELAQVDGAKVLTMDGSQPAVALNKTYYDADPANDLGGAVLVCSACSAPSMNNPNAMDADPVDRAANQNIDRWMLRTFPSNRFTNLVMTRYMLAQGAQGDVNGDGKLKIATLATDEVFGRSSANSLKATVEMLRPTPPPLVEQIAIDPQINLDSYDFVPDLAKLSDDYNETTMTTDGVPDFVTVFMLPKVNAGFIRAAVRNAFAIETVQSSPGRNDLIIRTLGNEAEGVYGIGHAVLMPGRSADTLTAVWSQEHGTDVPQIVPNVYDAGIVIALAIVKATLDLDDPSTVTPQAIKDALWTVQGPGGEPIHAGPDEFERAIGLLEAGTPIDYVGTSGPIDFDAHGNIRQRQALWRVVNQRYVEEQYFDCIKDDNCDPL